MKRITDFKQEALYLQADVTVADDLQNLVQQTIEKFGRIDILITNAGANVFEGAENCDEEAWH